MNIVCWGKQVKINKLYLSWKKGKELQQVIWEIGTDSQILLCLIDCWQYLHRSLPLVFLLLPWSPLPHPYSHSSPTLSPASHMGLLAVHQCASYSPAFRCLWLLLPGSLFSHHVFPWLPNVIFQWDLLWSFYLAFHTYYPFLLSLKLYLLLLSSIYHLPWFLLQFFVLLVSCKGTASSTASFVHCWIHRVCPVPVSHSKCSKNIILVGWISVTVIIVVVNSLSP